MEEYHKLRDYPHWVFRGVNNGSLDLRTSLERAILSLHGDKPDMSISQRREILGSKFGRNKRTVFDIEGGLIRLFRRQCHLHTQHVPINAFELLALMQHYEAPTRLQDWTYSFYVALFFAVDRASIERSKTASVWIVDTQWLKARFKVVPPLGQLP